jgi:hypothetical protein
VQRAKTRQVVDRAVEARHRALDVAANRFRHLDQAAEALACDLLLALTLRDALWVALDVRRQVAKCREDAEELAQVRVVLSDRRGQAAI